MNAVVHELLATTNDGDETPGSRPPAPKGRNSRPNSRDIPKARNPLAPLPTDTHNRRPSSRQREGTTPGSFRKVPPVPEAPHSEESDKRRPLSREQRRRVNARRKRESMGNGSSQPFGPSPTWSGSRAQHIYPSKLIYQSTHGYIAQPTSSVPPLVTYVWRMMCLHRPVFATGVGHVRTR